MTNRLGKSVTFWSIANNCALALQGLVVLPVQLRHLSPEEIGLWYSFVAMSSLVVMVCQGGITPTIQRFASYLHAGAQQLHAHGVPPACSSGPNWPRIAEFSVNVNRIFAMLSAVGMLLLTAIGLAIISLQVHDAQLRCTVYGAWLVQIAAIGVLIPAAGQTALVQGAGGMLLSQRRLLVARLIAPIATVGSLLAGLGLFSLGIGILAMAIIQWLTHRNVLPKSGSATGRTTSWREDGRALWPTTWRFILVIFGAWMITVSGTLIVGAFSGLADAGRYGLSLQALQFASLVSATWMSAAMPRICSLRASGDTDDLHRLFKARWVSAIGTYLFLVCGLACFGDWLLSSIGSKVSLIPLDMLLVFSLIFLLELNHGALCAGFLMSANQVPFVASAIYSGVSVMLLGVILAIWSGNGIWSVIIAQGAVQLAYNNWHWPLQVVKELSSSRPSLGRPPAE